MKKLLLSTVVAAGALLATGAQAGLVIQGGFGGIISAGTDNNTALAGLGLSDPLGGVFGGQIWTDAVGPGTLTYTFLGYEAGATNTFGNSSGVLLTAPGNSGNAFTTANVSAAGGAIAATSLLDFYFASTVSGTVPVVNGANGDFPLMNFFASQVDANTILLFLDDTGGYPGNDDNHDDMVVRVTFTPSPVTFVPEPASLALFGAGLLGLGLVRRRKSV